MRTPAVRGPRAALAAASVLLLPAALQAQADYHDYEEITAELRALTGGSSLASMSSIGTTLGGREIWVVEIANGAGADLADRPAVLVVGNLEGDHVVGSSHAVEMVRYVLANAGDDAVRTMLDTQVVYVIPRLNPDGAEAMFASVLWDRRGNDRAYDDDNDGRTDEDGPEDLNGDGMITLMRVADPAGAFMVDPDEPRLMKRADATEGETGTHSLYWEGTDSDGDGFINEDGPGGADLNRNFQHEYPYWEADAGVHMISEIETRGLMNFMITHRNVGAIMTFGHSDNLVTPPNSGGRLADENLLDHTAFANASFDGMYDVGVFGSGGGGFGGGFGGFGGGGGFRGAQLGSNNDPSAGRRPSVTVHADDQVYFTAASDLYKEVTGIERVGFNREAAGAFFQWGYYQFGVPSFSTQGWALPDAEEGESESGDNLDAQVLRALDNAFVDWTPQTHPEFENVEIGGFRPYVVTNPAEADLSELGARQGEFLVGLAGLLPRVSIVETEVTAHGGGIFTIEAEVANSGFFPTSLRHGTVSRSVQPTTVQIQIDPEDVLSGAPKTLPIQQLEGSGSRQKVTWVVRGQSGGQIEIRVRSQKGGTASSTVTLR